MVPLPDKISSLALVILTSAFFITFTMATKKAALQRPFNGGTD
jgi:hypothetical protein